MMSLSNERCVDLLGVGFGPANLALAVAHESAVRLNVAGLRALSVEFVERNHEFTWHPGMLLDDAEMQISFLKDLVTLHDPTSPFTFLNYLRQKNGLVDFINLRHFFPLRSEFRDYMRWVAGALADRVHYGHQVESIDGVEGSAGVESLRVRSVGPDGERTVLARNVAVAIGGTPRWPRGVVPQSSRFTHHSSMFLQALAREYRATEHRYKFLVVGAGQSAAEMFRHLYSNYPNAEVTLAISRYALRPADESEFANEIFNPEAIDFFFGAPQEVRDQLRREFANTNYAVVDPELIRGIYRDLYAQRLRGQQRAHVRRMTELLAVGDVGSACIATMRSAVDNSVEQKDYDGVFLGTGYDHARLPAVLSGIEKYVARDQTGAIQLQRDYSVTTTAGFKPRVFIQGPTEETHGLTSTLLSVLPFRAQEILTAISEAAMSRGRGLPHHEARLGRSASVNEAVP